MAIECDEARFAGLTVADRPESGARHAEVVATRHVTS